MMQIRITNAEFTKLLRKIRKDYPDLKCQITLTIGTSGPNHYVLAFETDDGPNDSILRSILESLDIFPHE